MSQQRKPFTTYYTGLIKYYLMIYFCRPQKPAYEQQMHSFGKFHNKLHENLQAFRVEIMAKEHEKATPVNIKERDNVMVRIPDRNSKLSPKLI